MFKAADIYYMLSAVLGEEPPNNPWGYVVSSALSEMGWCSGSDVIACTIDSGNEKEHQIFCMIAMMFAIYWDGKPVDLSKQLITLKVLERMEGT